MGRWYKREELGLETHFETGVIKNDEERRRVYSLVYDQFLGHHLLDSLVTILNGYYCLDRKKIKGDCRRFFHGLFPKSNIYFPENTYYFSNELLSENEYRLVDTGQIPQWR